VKANKCPLRADPEEFQRCPLCLDDIDTGIEGWKEHLIMQGCRKNIKKSI